MRNESILSRLTANDFKSGSIGHYEGFTMHTNKECSGSIPLPEEETGRVPLSRETRIKQLSELPNKSKEAFVPPVDQLVQLGPYIYRVAVRNVGGLRYTATLHDVVIKGINDM